MTLETLRAEMIIAMKNKDSLRKDVISSLVQAAKNFGINNGCRDNLTEEQIATVILKEKKTMQEMIDTCPVDRTEILEQYNAKMAIINEFAPTLMTDENEIKDFIIALGVELNKKSMGVVMKALKGKADMKIATKVFTSMI